MKLISSIFILLISLSVFGQPNKAGFNLGEITENPQDAERICYSNGTDTLSGWKIHTIDIIDGYGFVIVDIAGNEVIGGFEVDEKYCLDRRTIYTEEFCFHGYFYYYDNTVPSDGACGTPSANYGLNPNTTEWVSFENNCDNYDSFAGEIITGANLNGYFDAMETILDNNTNTNWDWGLDVPNKCWRFFTTISPDQCYGKWEKLYRGNLVEVIPRIQYAKCELTKKVCEEKDDSGNIKTVEYYYTNNTEDGLDSLILDLPQYIIECTGWNATAVNNVYPDNASVISHLTTDCATRKIEPIESNCEIGSEIVCSGSDGSGIGLTLYWSICDGIYSQTVYETASLSGDPSTWIEYVGELANCDGTPFEEPKPQVKSTGITKCAVFGGEKVEIKEVCLSDGSMDWVNCKDNSSIKITSKKGSQLPLTNGVAFLDCNCDYFISFEQFCTEPNGIRFYLQREVIRNCDQADEVLVYFDTDQTTELTQSQIDAILAEDSTFQSDDNCGELIPTCYFCEQEETAPPPTKGDVKTKTKVRVKETSPRCVYGQEVEVLSDQSDNIVSINGEAATVFNANGYSEVECGVSIKTTDLNVCIVNLPIVEKGGDCATTNWGFAFGSGAATLDEGGITFITSFGSCNIPEGTVFTDVGAELPTWLNDNCDIGVWSNVPGSGNDGVMVCSDTEVTFIVGDDAPQSFEDITENFPCDECETEDALMTKLCDADIQAIADAISDNQIRGIYNYCYNNLPVVYCLDGKDLTFYQNGELLVDPIFHDCNCPVEADLPPIGDQAICASRKLGADFNSNAVGEGTHLSGSLFDGNGALVDWSGTFTVTDSNGSTHIFTDGQTVSGLSSGSVQQVTYTGMIHWVDGADEYRCPVTDKAISANFTVQ